ncbi:MAG: diguanylate cyclase [Gaiellales bacterium]
MDPARPSVAPNDDAFDAAVSLREGEQSLAVALDAVREDAARAAVAYRAVVRSLAMALAARDGYTGSHSDIVQNLAVAVATRLGLSLDEIDEIKVVALLHDVGKLGIPDEVLHKRTPLTAEEWELMRTHPAIGERILEPLPGFERIAAAVRHEHERWDGLGYPDGLKGDEIPLASRIVLACDAFHALVSDRPYRRALGLEAAIAELDACAGSQFDPSVIEALLAAIRGDAARSGPPAVGRRGDVLAPSSLDLEVRALLTIASSAVSCETLEELIEVAADESVAAVGAASVSISRCEADARVLRVIVNAGELAEWEERRPAAETYRLDDDDIARDYILAGRSVTASLDDPAIAKTHRELLKRLEKSSFAAVPIMIRGVPWGEFIATRGTGAPRFGEREVRLLQTIAGQISAAAGRMAVFAQMAELAFRDPLTGVGNRRAFDERIELAVAEASAGKRMLAVALCDLDNLRELNEGGGHQAGDEALRAVGAALAEAVAPHPVFRLGGDEFAVPFVDLSLDQAYALGQKILEHMPDGLTMSCGVAELTHGSRTADLLRAADQALYVAKRSGRARVCAASSSSHWAWPDRSPDAPRERRHGRRRKVDVAQLLERTLRALDGPLASSSALARIEAVASLAAESLGLARAAVSHTTPQGTVTPVITFDFRSGRTWAREFGGFGDPYELADYPETARILARGGSFYYDVASTTADPAEVALLNEWGLEAVVAAAAAGADRSWLLELYADAETAALDQAEAALRLLVAEAVAKAHPGALEPRASLYDDVLASASRASETSSTSPPDVA